MIDTNLNSNEAKNLNETWSTSHSAAIRPTPIANIKNKEKLYVFFENWYFFFFFDKPIDEQRNSIDATIATKLYRNFPRIIKTQSKKNKQTNKVKNNSINLGTSSRRTARGMTAITTPARDKTTQILNRNENIPVVVIVDKPVSSRCNKSASADTGDRIAAAFSFFLKKQLTKK